MVGAEFGHDVTGAVIAVFVEHLGGDLRALVVPGEHLLGLHQQLTARVGLVGAEVAQIRHVDEFVVDHRRALDVTIDEHRTGFSRAVAFQQVHVE